MDKEQREKLDALAEGFYKKATSSDKEYEALQTVAKAAVGNMRQGKDVADEDRASVMAFARAEREKRDKTYAMKQPVCYMGIRYDLREFATPETVFESVKNLESGKIRYPGRSLLKAELKRHMREVLTDVFKGNKTITVKVVRTALRMPEIKEKEELKKKTETEKKKQRVEARAEKAAQKLRNKAEALRMAADKISKGKK